ncbi:hypothetical protein ACP4OV_003589 [Aristida adscensionis]
MADSDCCSSSSAATAAPAAADPDVVITGALPALGNLNYPSTLQGLIAENRWLDVAEHLDKALRFHPAEAAAAVAYPDDAPSPADMLRAHPELYVLPRRQHALELLGKGKPASAQQYCEDSIFRPIRLARRTPHLDALLAKLWDRIAGGRSDKLILGDERRMTSRHIWDYLRVYFPSFNRGAEVAASIAMSKKALFTVAEFGEAIDVERYRCLVCHQTLYLMTAPDFRLIEHLHGDCPAVTPHVRRRLPRRNRPPWQQPAAQAAGAADDHHHHHGGGGGAAGGGADGDHPPPD